MMSIRLSLVSDRVVWPVAEPSLVGRRGRVCGFLIAVACAAPSLAESSISEVSLSAMSFSPARGGSVEIRYELARPASVTTEILDPDGGLVAVLSDATSRDAGQIVESWNGRDWSGKVVPDEAYTVRIETKSGDVFDPASSEARTVGDVTDAQFDRDSGTVTYALPRPARVLIRCGLHSGPMLKTLVDWKPRVGGSITEYWDGMDQNRVASVSDQASFSALITFETLPSATVITYGNREEGYRDYKLGRGKDRPIRSRGQPSVAPRIAPASWQRSPTVSLNFPDRTDEIPLVSGAVDVRVDVDEADRQQLLSDQFEVIFFVDNEFFAEAERGHLPYNWRWELQHLKPGEHVLTVNITSFTGQVGVASRKIRVSAATGGES